MESRCDHSNETSSAVLLHGSICLSAFFKMKFGNFVELCLRPLLGAEEINGPITAYVQYKRV